MNQIVNLKKERLCRYCKTYKPISEFYEHAHGRSFYQCKECAREHQRKLQEKHRAKLNEENENRFKPIEILKPQYWTFIKPMIN